MTSQASRLRKIDEQGAILFNLKQAGRISEARYVAALRRLVAEAERLLARQS